MDLERIKEQLAQQAEAVARHLLPSGREERGEWVCGDIHGGEGSSFRVHLNGPKVGKWADFANQEQYRGGNLLGLWTACRGGDFKKALAEVKDFLGIKESGWQRQSGDGAAQKKAALSIQKKSAPPVKDLTAEICPLTEAGTLWKWLTENRKISGHILRAYRVGQNRDGTLMALPYYSADDRLELIKFVNPYTGHEDRKIFTLGQSKLLFGWQALYPEQQDCFITEGEFDAMAMATACGCRALSVPFGAKWPGADGHDPNDEWILHDFEALQRFEEVFLCLDADEPGQRATKALIPRFGRHRVRLVTWPEGMKDANDCLKAGITSRGMLDLIDAAGDLKPSEMRLPSEFAEQIWEEFYPVNGERPGSKPPWGVNFRFRDGEVTIWHGYNGHGKTAMLNHCLGAFAEQGQKSCVASLEMRPWRTFKNMLRQGMGKTRPADKAELARALEFMDKWFWIYAHIGAARIEEIMEVFHYAAQKYGVKHFVLDSLMMVEGIKNDDYGSQRDLLLLLSGFAKTYSAHVHMVCHSKKPDSRHPEKSHWPSKFDISGSGDLSNAADNVICAWRNLEKTEMLEKAANMLASGIMEEAAQGMTIKQDWEYREDALWLVQKDRVEGVPITRRLRFDGNAETFEGSWQFFDEKQHPGPDMAYIEGFNTKDLAAEHAPTG